MEDVAKFVFYIICVVLLAYAIVFIIDDAKERSEIGHIDRLCALDGYAWSEVRDNRVYCINYTSEPSILLLGDYEELAREME